ncbi:hypothetical protein A4A49_07139 [Nicotiana attenuata]|uniref:Uncharacterized protein n=1 Tax=Nicotiana attenuata TaxID=49451 RepID=A0A314KW00_NICAT|nr:hypothetical protein A4A49_07139 [Nicotiana attenuata]
MARRTKFEMIECFVSAALHEDVTDRSKLMIKSLKSRLTGVHLTWCGVYVCFVWMLVSWTLVISSCSLIVNRHSVS